MDHTFVGSFARPSSSKQADFQPSKNSIEYILANEWQKQNKLIIVMSLIDVSYLFVPDAKDVVMDKFANLGDNNFTLRNRGESMRKLSVELQASKDNKIRIHISVQDFYHFFLYLKEVMPVMKHLSQKYANSQDYMGVDNSQKFLDLILQSSAVLDEDDDFVDISPRGDASKQQDFKFEENKENSQDLNNN